MKQNISLLTLSIKATGAIAISRGVTHAGAQGAAQGAKIIGIARTAAASGDMLAVVAKGTAIVEAGAAVAVGDSVIIDSSGRAIPTTGALEVATGSTAVTSSAANGDILTGADLPEYVFGDALEAASGAGDFIEVLMR
jgi:hypothetical protein